MYSSQHLGHTTAFPQTCMSSHLISNLIESVVSMAKLKMSPEFVSTILSYRSFDVLDFVV